MALNTEVWLRHIVEGLYPDNSFASKSVDDSEYVTNKTVHIPNAGKPSGVEKNRKKKPADVSERTDVDLEYSIDEFTTNPIHISNRDAVELSYDKRKSVLGNDAEELNRVARVSLLESWAKGYGAVIKTSGGLVPAHTKDATGNRKSITRSDIRRMMTQFDDWEIPEGGRYILLDAHMYGDLLDSLTESQRAAFLSSANAQKGIVGELYGFNIMKRSTVLRIKSDGETLLLEGEAHEANECAAGLAWHERCVSRAIGERRMFSAIGDPGYYGDIYSFLVRAGGSYRREDKRGVALIVQVAA